MARRVQTLVAQRVDEELERRKDEIEAEVLRRVQDAKRDLEAQMVAEMERQRQLELEAQQRKQVGDGRGGRGGRRTTHTRTQTPRRRWRWRGGGAGGGGGSAVPAGRSIKVKLYF